MKDRNLASSFALSSAIHLAILPLAAIILIKSKPILPPIDVSLIDVPKLEKKEPIVAPEPKKIEKVEKIKPPKLIEKTEMPKPQSIPAPPVAALPPPPIPAAGPEKGSVASKGPAGEAAGAEAGAGALFGAGDVAVVPGAGVAGGGGGKASAGLGRGEKGDGSGGGSEGLTQTARPLGGYQVTPRYPESARRIHFQGVTLLRVRVLDNGRVGEVRVEKSAGHRDLDLSAAEAVQKWIFEPARRGPDRVAVWVLIPVSFELQ